MIGRHTSFLARIGVLVGILVPLLGAQTAGRHAGAGVQTLDLVAQPDAGDLTNARKAFRDGDIVRIAGGKPQDLQRLLGIGGAILTRSTVPGNGAPNASLPQNDTALLYQIVAARATATGALHEFQQLGTDIIGAANGGTSTAYEAWAEKEAQLAQAEESGSLPTDPTPPQTKLWTELQQSTFRNTDAQGNIFQNTISIYRLNDTSPSNDWYMILTDPQSQPNYTGCGAFGTGSCGWWTDQRVFTMSTVPQAILFNHGPLNTISSSTAQFMIGGNINGVNAAYSVSWQQPSVTTTDQSDLANGTGKWTEDFQGQGSFGSTPPTTSTGLFVSHQGSIFQVPEGTTSFQFTLNEPVTSEFQPHFGEPYTWTSNYNVQINIFPPVFLTSLNNLSIPPGGSGSFEITAVNPSTSNSSLGLAWEVTNLPLWLTVSQTSGSSSARLTLNVAPETALGTVGSLNVNTNPASAAPSVENKPLLVRVTVGQPNDTGIMLAGGSDAQGRIQDVADLYSPQLGQFDFESTMQSPRRDHSATLLLSGKLLIAGGSTMPRTATASAELFDPEAAQFSATAGMMSDSRSMHTASLLPNGTVLLAGGVDTASLNGSGDSLATAELYDPATETFTATGSMTAMRVLHSSTSLLDGTVLIAGGQPNRLFSPTLNTAEIYDPGTGRFAATSGNMASGRYSHTATLLKDGHVLIAGGFNENGAIVVAELYNPATKTFSTVGTLNVARAGHTATLLSDGTVLITGGRGENGDPLASAELYDPETQTFTLLSGTASCPGSAGCMTTARAYHTATPELDGTVLIACGLGPVQSVLGSTELYNPQTRTFSAGPSTTPKIGPTATLLQRPATTIVLTSSLNPSAAGQKITLTATVTARDGVAPTGSVTFQDGTDVLGTQDLQPSSKGVVNLSVSSLTVGPHTLTAKYSGDGDHAKSTSNVVVQTVKSQATATTLRSSLNPSNDGQLVTFTATVTPEISGTPTGSVVFRNSGTELGTVPLTGNTANYSTSSLSPGSNGITATYTGDSSFASSGSPVLTQNVAKLSSTVALTSKPNPASFGEGVQITATVTSTGGAPGGSVMFKDGNAVLRTVPLQSGVASFTISDLSLGSHLITGTYSGDLTHAGATSAPLQQRITRGSSTVSLSSAPNPSQVGQNVTFTATVRTTSSRSPNGTVTFLDGTSLLGKGPIKNGIAALTLSTLAPGSHSITANYGGNRNIAGSVSPVVTQVVAGLVTPTVTLTVQPGTANFGSLVTFTATVSYPGGPVPTGSVTISNVRNGSETYGVAVLNNGVGVVMNSTIPVGSYNLVATYGGDGGTHYNGAQSNSVSLRIAPAGSPLRGRNP